MDEQSELEFLDNNNSLYLPMHQDNLVYFLSSGYIGGAVDNSKTVDFQNSTGCKLSGFREFPPSWATSYGDQGTKVVLEVGIDIQKLVKKDCYLVYDEFLKITDAKCVYFMSETELQEFNATFDQFAEIPEKLIKQRIHNFDVSEPLSKENLERTENKNFTEEIFLKDSILGWTARSLTLLEKSEEFEIILKIFKDSSSQKNENSMDRVNRLALQYCQPESPKVDSLIWETVSKLILEYKGQQGFDKKELVGKVKEITSKHKKVKDEVEKWIIYLNEIIDAERDLPELNDEDGKIGRRAALYAILFKSFEEVNELASNKVIGKKITLLISLLSSSFDGFSRKYFKIKQTLEDYELVLDLAERIEARNKTTFRVKDFFTNPQLLTKTEIYTFNNKKVFQRTESAPQYVLTLANFIGNLGVKLNKDKERNFYFLEVGGNEKIFCLPKKQRNIDTILFRLVIEEKIDTEKLVPLLRIAADYGVALGIFEDQGKDCICAFIRLLPDTLDQAEFDFMVKQLREFNEAAKKV